MIRFSYKGVEGLIEGENISINGTPLAAASIEELERRFWWDMSVSYYPSEESRLFDLVRRDGAKLIEATELEYDENVVY